MHIIFILIGFSLLVALIFLGIYIWAVRNGQFDDQYTPSVRMLYDDDEEISNKSSKSEIQENRSMT